MTDYRLELLTAAHMGQTVFVGTPNDRFRAIVAPTDTGATHGPITHGRHYLGALYFPNGPQA